VTVMMTVIVVPQLNALPVVEEEEGEGRDGGVGHSRHLPSATDKQYVQVQVYVYVYVCMCVYVYVRVKLVHSQN
jgi:hypothetical protein